MRTPCDGRQSLIAALLHQQPACPAGITPGVAAAPVALAAAIVPGLDRLIVTPSVQDEPFGVGAGIVPESRLVSPPAMVSGEIEPGGGLAGTCGVESDSDDGGVAGPPGILLQTVACDAPTGDEETVPVLLPAGVLNDDDVDNADGVVPVAVTVGTAAPASNNGDGAPHVT